MQDSRRHRRRKWISLQIYSKNVKVQANSSDNYRQIIKFLNTQQNAQFHSYQLQNEKPFRVVIRNFHPSTPCDDIKSALENFSLSVLQVVNVLQRQTKIPLPLFDVAKITFHPCATNQMKSRQPARCAKETIPPTTVAVKSTSIYKRIASSPQHQPPKMYTLLHKKPAHR